MDIRIDGAHEEALQNLQNFNGEKTATTEVRRLIREEAQRLNLWPSSSNGKKASDVSAALAQQ